MNTQGEQYFIVSMVTHTVTTETVKYCSPEVFSYIAFFTVYTPSGMPNNYMHACVNACVHDMVWDACLLGQHVKKCMAIFQ